MSITLHGTNSASGTNSFTMTLQNAAALNDLIVIQMNLNPSTKQFPTVSDTLNGAYNVPSTLNFFSSQNTGGGFFVQSVIAWVKVTTAGLPTITVTCSGQSLSADNYLLTGWTNGPTLNTSDISTLAQGNSTAPAAPGVTNSYSGAEANMVFVSYAGGSPTLGSITGSYTQATNDGGTHQYAGYDITASSGNALSWAGTFTVATPWWVAYQAGWNDTPPAPTGPSITGPLTSTLTAALTGPV